MDQTDQPPCDPDDGEGDLEPDAEQAKRVTGGSAKTSPPTGPSGKDSSEKSSNRR